MPSTLRVVFCIYRLLIYSSVILDTCGERDVCRVAPMATDSRSTELGGRHRLRSVTSCPQASRTSRSGASVTESFVCCGVACAQSLDWRRLRSPQAPELRTTVRPPGGPSRRPFGIWAAVGGLGGGLRVMQGLSFFCGYDEWGILPEVRGQV